MAGRWRAAQRRKRWTDHAALLPAASVRALERWPELLRPLVQQLGAFESQPSIYAQLTQVKPLGKVLLRLLQQDGLKSDARASKACVRCYLEILFVENSRPLHRGLLSSLCHVPAEFSALMQEAFLDCCLEYGPGGPRERKFAVVAVAASLAGLPQPGVMKDVAQNSVFFTAHAACRDVQAVLQHALQGGRPTPTVMEEAQNALSSVYYLLQQFPERFRASCDGPNSESPGSKAWTSGDLFGAVVSLLLDVLQTSVLSRDCVVAAGVGLAAAAQLLHADADGAGLALLLARMAFPSACSQFAFAVLWPERGLAIERVDGGTLDAVVVKYRKSSSLCYEMGRLSEFGKLCFFRGILTAVSRNSLSAFFLRAPRGAECGMAPPAHKDDARQWRVWTLLYDGILPALCAFCESSVDSHFKFHAVTALQICLQQIKTSICGHLTLSLFDDLASSARIHSIDFPPYVPLPGAMVARILQLIWNNWEDPLTQTVKQVQLVFDLLVDVQLVLRSDMFYSQVLGSATASPCDDARKDNFLYEIASDLLSAGRYRKGKYVPLASLVQRIGARKLLAIKPDLLFQTIHAFSDDDVCCAAGTFYKSFLERLREDCWSSDGVMEGTVAARRLWIPPLFSGLLAGDSRLRNNLTTYALPVALQIDSDSVLVMLDFILKGHTGAESCLSMEELGGSHGLPSNLSVDQQVVLLISVLKVARTIALALVEGAIGYTLKPADNSTARYEREVEDELIASKVLKGMSHAVFTVKGQAVEVHVNLLLAALTHKEDGLRVDATELMCLNPKTASMPSPLEICLLRIALPLNMRCSSTSFRMRWTSFIKKFFHHARSSVERQLKASNVGKGPNGGAPEDITSNLAVSVSEMQEFMQWLSQMLISSLYPSAPYERKNMAMELFYALIQVWSVNEFWEKRFTDTLDFSPYHRSLLSADSTLVVVGAIVDSWDKLRENAYRILVCYPTPLPGLDSESKVEGLLRWAKSLASSPRVRESDAGALALRLIFRKYVVELGWVVKIHPEPHVVRPTSTCQNGSNCSPAQKTGEMVLQYLESLNDWLQWGIEEGDKDLLKACRQSFVHGVLLVLRYTVDEIDWTSASVQRCFGSFRATLERLLALLLRVTSLALWVVSADALILKSKLDESPSGAQDSEDREDELAGSVNDRADIDDEYDSDVEEGLAPAEQIVMVGCWLSVKEVSLLLGTIARAVPLPGTSEFQDRREENGNAQTGNVDINGSNVMLDGKQLEAIGSHFLQVLLSMKHNGAIDKTRTGFIALCDRLLRSGDPWLNRMPESWLQQLTKHTGAKGQVVDDLLRRSAGIPPAFLALFLAEPEGAPKKLLPLGMRWLLNTCSAFLAEAKSQNHSDGLEVNVDVPVSGTSKVHTIEEVGENNSLRTLKSRDEGVVPTVHAFNVLRVVFHDTNLATDTSGFCAEGLMTAIQAFSSSHWEIRNGATLAFTALVHRMIGFLNVYQRESAKRAITGFEFFHRYPTLHPFLLQELKSATWQLEHGATGGMDNGHGLASTLHPSLAPVLIILSRLNPSFINSEVEDWLNPSAFMPYVSQCATQRNLQVRVLASRALAPLVSSEDLLQVLIGLAGSLPVSAETKKLQACGLEPKTTSTERWSGGARVSGIMKVSSYNAIHGVLLQMYALFSSNCISLPDRDLQVQILTEIFHIVKHCSWLGSINHCCCSIVVGAFLDMLGGLLELAEVYQEDSQSFSDQLHELLTSLTGECLEESGNGSGLHDPTRVGLREKAAKLYFRAVFSQMEGSSDDYKFLTKVTSKLGTMLSDASYEVRLTTLKVLKLYCSLPRTASSQRSDMPSCRDFSFLKPVVMQRLRTESHPLCIRRILQLTFSWSLMDKRDLGVRSSSMEEDMSARDLWNALLKIYWSSEQIKTKEASVRCVGGSLQHVRSIIEKLTRPISRDVSPSSSTDTSSDPHCREGDTSVAEEQWSYVQDVLSMWLRIANKHSDASEPVTFRRATAEAIIASGLLDDTQWLGKALDARHGVFEKAVLEDYGKAILSVWCITIKLMEDEDLDLRQNLSLAVLKVVASSGLILDVVPAQVEKVIQVSFDFLSSRLGTWTPYYSVLSEWLIGTNIDFTLNNSNGDLVRRLFDKEIDNHHEEELLFVQLCCSHLEKFMSLRFKRGISVSGDCSTGLSTSSMQELSLRRWRMRHLNQARLCAKFSVHSMNSIQWVGGVTNHQDTFKSLYRSLLGLLTFSGVRKDVGSLFNMDPSEGEELVTGLIELTFFLRQLSLNPLVSNILVLVLDAYEKQLGRSLGFVEFKAHLEDAFITNFEPLFLIR
ncbi:hypothetical protein Mapa_017546 [Marchantia paleacea]|nr:hypothetical protein Mapa_017546 [Marchantia paleacea]